MKEPNFLSYLSSVICKFKWIMLFLLLTTVSLISILNGYFQNNEYISNSLPIIQTISFYILLILGVNFLYTYKTVYHLKKFPFILYRILIYSFIFGITLTATFFFFTNFGFSLTNIDSARYFLSAMIQSKASIIAIVITLSLIAIQQNSDYSPRIVKLFKNIKTNPDFYILISIYLLSIFYDTWILKQLSVSINEPFIIKNFNKTILFENMEMHLLHSIAFSIFAFVALLPYLLNTLDLLNPTKIVELLGENINKNTVSNSLITSYNIDTILNYTDHEGYIKNLHEGIKIHNLEYYKNGNFVPFPSILSDESYFKSMIQIEKNPYQPIFEITYNSIIKSQFEVARKDINIIRNSIREVPKKDIEENYLLFSHINFELTKIANVAIENKEEYCVEQIMSIIYYNTNIFLNNYPEIKNFDSILQIEKIGTFATTNKSDFLSYTSQLLLFFISMNALEKEIKDALIIAIAGISKMSNLLKEQNNELYTTSKKMIEHIILLSEQQQVDFLQDIMEYKID